MEGLARLADGEPSVDTHTRTISLPVEGGAAALVEAIRILDDRGVQVLDIGLRRPTLDDVFLSLTGHSTTQELP
jgi:ABC-2 type transport system ATP-binding protein